MARSRILTHSYIPIENLRLFVKRAPYKGSLEELVLGTYLLFFDHNHLNRDESNTSGEHCEDYHHYNQQISDCLILRYDIVRDD